VLATPPDRHVTRGQTAKVRKPPLSLRTYLALSRTDPAAVPPAARAPRPAGPLVWAHAANPQTDRALASLCTRIQSQSDGAHVLLTGVASSEHMTDAIPADTPAQAQAFLDHWQPDLCLWSGEALRPALLHCAARADCRLALIGAGDTGWSTPGPRWLPDTAPAVLQGFDVIFAQNAAAERDLRRMGVSGDRLRRSGPLAEATLPLDCRPELHEEMSELLSGRPVWTAARIRQPEADLVLNAHRAAARLAHRLLLILVPADPSEAEAFTVAVHRSGLRSAFWGDGDMPDENTQVLMAPGPEELGLWYRLAPVCFLGGSLAPGFGGHDPFEAAALGSAVLYGPNVGQHLGAYSRLVDAGAARIVRDEHSLSGAVSQMIAPDQAAAMAHAGWDVVSAGAEMTDRVVEQALHWLDQAQRR